MCCVLLVALFLVRVVLAVFAASAVRAVFGVFVWVALVVGGGVRIVCDCC